MNNEIPNPVRKTKTGQIMCYETGQVYLLPTQGGSRRLNDRADA